MSLALTLSCFCVNNCTKQFSVELFKLGRKYANKWKGIYRIWAYPFGAVNIYNPEDIEVLF